MGYITLEEAEDVLPEVAFLVEEAVSVYDELREIYSKIRTVSAKLKVTGKSSDGKTVSRISPVHKRKVQVLTEELNDIMEEIEELGGVLRDVETGEVEFPSKFQGQKINFTWKVGEERIEYWIDNETGSKHKILRLGTD